MRRWPGWPPHGTRSAPARLVRPRSWAGSAGTGWAASRCWSLLGAILLLYVWPAQALAASSRRGTAVARRSRAASTSTAENAAAAGASCKLLQRPGRARARGAAGSAWCASGERAYVVAGPAELAPALRASSRRLCRRRSRPGARAVAQGERRVIGDRATSADACRRRRWRELRKRLGGAFTSTSSSTSTARAPTGPRPRAAPRRRAPTSSSGDRRARSRATRSEAADYAGGRDCASAERTSRLGGLERGSVVVAGVVAGAADHDLVLLDRDLDRAVAGPVLGVDGVVRDRGVEPQAVALLAVVEGALERRCLRRPRRGRGRRGAATAAWLAVVRPRRRPRRSSADSSSSSSRLLLGLRPPPRARRRSARRPRRAGRSRPRRRAARSRRSRRPSVSPAASRARA